MHNVMSQFNLVTHWHSEVYVHFIICFVDFQLTFFFTATMVRDAIPKLHRELKFVSSRFSSTLTDTHKQSHRCTVH